MEWSGVLIKITMAKKRSCEEISDQDHPTASTKVHGAIRLSPLDMEMVTN